MQALLQSAYVRWWRNGRSLDSKVWDRRQDGTCASWRQPLRAQCARPPVADANAEALASMAGISWDTIESFVGYGRREAPIVFIGMEEGLAKGDELDSELLLRSTYTQYMDLHASFGNELEAFLRNPGRRPTWIAMSAIALAHLGTSDPDYADCRKYMLSDLGRSNGKTLLTELLPYPSANIDTWKYDRFTDRKAYANALLFNRLELLKAIVDAPGRELVVAYGKSYWDKYKLLFPTCQWSESGKFEYGRYRDARIVLAPHFASRPFNGTIGRKRLTEGVFA